MTANDRDQSSSFCEKQHKEIKQEHHQEWWKPYCSCGSFCAILFLGGLSMVQNVQKMRSVGQKVNMLIIAHSMNGPRVQTKVPL